MSVQQKLLDAVSLQNKGESKKAATLFLQILKQTPQNIYALYSLAAIESNAGNYQAAHTYAQRAVKIDPKFAPAQLALSIVAMRLGQLDEAETALATANAIQPELPGVSEQQKNLAEVKKIVGSTPQGTQTVDPRALALNTDALKLQDQGQWGEAKKTFLKVLTISPADFIATYSIGFIEHRDGNTQAAIDWLNKAVSHDPLNPQGHYALATVLQTAGLYEAAIEHFDKAAELNPQLMEVYNNKATLLHTLHRHFEALTTLDKALAVNPTDQKSLHNKGYILTEYKQHKIAADIFSHLLALNPDYEYAEGLRALARLHSCDWTGFQENKQRILQGLTEGKRVCNPFAVMAITDDLKAHQQCAEIFGEHRFPQAKELLWKGEVYRHRKKRVAFISADFREHPVGYLMVGMLEKLDKSQFELAGISLGIRDESKLYQRYRNLFDHYLDCREKPSIEIAQVMRAMEIDIAIDLSGYTAGSRLEILSYRPAPVQITYLGFPGGLSVPYIDYLIADRGTIPEDLQSGYKEKILYLPHCYLPRDTSVRPAPTTIARAEFGLPADAVVLCSFNHDYKINPPVFEQWMTLLSETPKSVLWLMKLNEAAQQNLQASANNYGIDPSRLIFAERVPRIEDHLARYRHVDLFLDTYPYNGHTTTSDALLVGTPVVTLSGTGFQSRVAKSLLSDVGKTDAAATSLLEYLTKARQQLEKVDLTRAERMSEIEPEWPVNEQQQADAFADALNSASPLG